MYVNDKEIRVFGLKRSGNHAIVNWIMSPYKGTVFFVNNVKEVDPFQRGKGSIIEIKGDFKFSYKRKILSYLKNYNKESFILAINDKNVNLEVLRRERKDLLLLGYEGLDLQNDNIFGKFEEKHDSLAGKSKEIYNLILLRDPYNLFASRIKKGITNLKNIEEHLCLWRKYANEHISQKLLFKRGVKIFVNYNIWHSSEEYRKNIATELNITFDDKGKKGIPHYGQGSSFPGADYNNNFNVLERFKDPSINNAILNKVINDKEIKHLSDRIFGKIL